MAYIIIYILCLALGLAVLVMLLWNIYQIGKGVTTVEGYDHGIYADRARSRGEVRKLSTLKTQADKSQ
jgi:hypothetical protein